MKIGVIGVGLIGGSLALSASEHIPDLEIYGKYQIKNFIVILL